MIEEESGLNSLEKVDDLNETANKIYELKDTSELDNLVNAFMLAHIKKDAVRSAKFSELKDAFVDQLEKRITKKPDEFSNKDLLDCINILSAQEQKSKENVINKESTNTSTVTINTVTVNQEPARDRDSDTRVIDAVNKLLEIINKNDSSAENIIDVETLNTESEGENIND